MTRRPYPLWRRILVKSGYYRLIALILRRTSGFPIWTNLEIDIQSSCNRDCDFCPRFDDRSGVRKDAAGKQIVTRMPSAQVYRLIDQAHRLGFQGKVKLHRLSESLLDTRYLEFARYIKAKGLKLCENTNGDVLRKNDALCAQLDGVVEHFTIGLYDCRDEQEEQQEMAYWRSKFKQTKIAFSLPAKACTIRQGSKIYQLTQKDPQALELPCLQPRRMMLVRYDGEVSLCCEDDGCHFDLGNAFEQSLTEIWWSYRHIRIARALEQRGGRHKFERCSTCYNRQDKVSLGENIERSAARTAVVPAEARDTALSAN